MAQNRRQTCIERINIRVSYYVHAYSTQNMFTIKHVPRDNHAQMLAHDLYARVRVHVHTFTCISTSTTCTVVHASARSTWAVAGSRGHRSRCCDRPTADSPPSPPSVG